MHDNFNRDNYHLQDVFYCLCVSLFQGADNVLPDIDLGSHRHGITQRSGRSTAMSWAGTRPLSRQNTEGSVALPKTYSTRKGALQLFVGPDVEPEEKTNQPLKPMYSQLRRQFTKQELVDLSLKLGTIERFTKSVLQYGDEVSKGVTPLEMVKNYETCAILHRFHILNIACDCGSILNSLFLTLKKCPEKNASENVVC